MIFPQPRHIRTFEGQADLGGPLDIQRDLTLPAQGYRLRSGQDGVGIRYRDELGLRYALSTLDQLRSDLSSWSRPVEIDDCPDLLTRGFLLDVSRDRVPTRQTLLHLIDVLALARFTQLELYIEHTFTFEGEDEVWQDASPLTPDDLHWLDRVCTSRGIMLVGCVNTFGHLERFLADPRHRHRAENEAGFRRGSVLRAPSTVEPTPANADFATGLATQVAGCLRSRRINIGADEPFELGTGKSAERVAEHGLAEVYLDHLTSLLRPWLDRGFNVEFWADVFVDHPELASRVPAGAIPVVWQYDSPASARAVLDQGPLERAAWEDLGADVVGLAAGFRHRAASLIAAGEPFWVAPGTGNWNSVLGRLDNAIENIVDAMDVAAENACDGMLLTSWGDHGHWDPVSVSYAPALFGGAAAWCLGTNQDVDLRAVLSQHVFADETGVLGDVLIRVGSLARSMGVPLLNGSPIVRALLIEGGMPITERPDDESRVRARRELHECLALLPDAEPASAEGRLVARELTHAIKLTDFALELMGDDDAPHAVRALDELLAEQRACWLLRSQPGGLQQSLDRFLPLRRQLVHSSTPSARSMGCAR